MIIKELAARLGIDIDFDSFAKADSTMAKAKATLDAVVESGKWVVDKLSDAVKQLIDTASAIKDTSQQVGLSTDAMQGWAYAAGLAGASSDDLATGVKKLSINMYNASIGNAEAALAFSKLGVGIRGTNGKLKTADDVLFSLADKFSTMPDGARKTAIAVDLLGKAGTKLVPLLSGGRVEIEKSIAEARELGAVLDTKTIDAAEGLGDSFDKLQIFVKVLSGTIAAEFLPQIIEVVDALIAWSKANGKLLFSRIGAALGAVTKVIAKLLSILAVLNTVLGVVIDNWRLFAVILYAASYRAVVANTAALAGLIGRLVLAGLTAVVSGRQMLFAWLASIAPIIAIGAAIAAILLIVDDVITYFQGGKSLLGEIIPLVSKFINDFAYGGSDTDPWWLTGLRELVQLLLHFGSVWSQFIKIAQQYFMYLFTWIKDTMSAAITSSIDKVKGAFNVFKDAKNYVFNKGYSAGASLGSAPQNRSVSFGAVRVEQTIVQQPGQDSKAVAAASVTELDAYLAGQMQQARVLM